MKKSFPSPYLSQIEPDNLEPLAKIFQSAAVFAVDKNRKITFWSEGAERLLGFSAKNLVGENCLTGNRCQQCLEGCGISEHGQINGFPIILYNANGEPVNFRKYATASIDDDGNFNGGIEVLIPDDNNPEINQDLPGTVKNFHGLVSADPVMLEIFKLVVRVAESDVNVLVRGESGSGKELIARAIHNESPRRNKPFMALNCASLGSNLLESELFGHVKGAFTDAIRDHIGLMSRAQGGTLFLDEVAEIPLETQAKLLRVIQEREYTPLGSNEVIKADIRILSATHRSLRRLTQEGKFREDLMYRLRVVPVFLPPLRERKNDIPILLNHFMHEFQKIGLRKIRDIHPDTMRLLMDYDWPGNVRELKNVLEYANAVSKNESMSIDDLPPEFLENKSMAGRKSSSAHGESEENKIKKALKASAGDINLAAEILNMSRTTLWRKRKKYQL